MPTLLDPDHVAALMSPGIDAVDLVLVIEREEDWLANDPVDGIGQLVGERVDELWVTPGDDRPLLLRRPTAAVEVVDGGVALAADDVRLLGGTRVEPRRRLARPDRRDHLHALRPGGGRAGPARARPPDALGEPVRAGVLGRPRLHPPGRPGRDPLAPGPLAVAAPRRDEHAAADRPRRADG